jgi:AAA+ superfamily predicted ATPase
MQEVLSKIQEAYARAKEYAPSIVLLDNVHDLMPALSEEAGMLRA